LNVHIITSTIIRMSLSGYYYREKSIEDKQKLTVAIILKFKAAKGIKRRET